MTDGTTVRAGGIRESALWRKLRPGILSVAPGADLVRVENVSDPGTPDVSYCIDKIEGWAELKSLRGLGRGGSIPSGTIRTAQSVWIRRRCRAGGRVYVLIGVTHPAPGVYVLPGRRLEAALETSLPHHSALLSYDDWGKIVLAMIQ